MQNSEKNHKITNHDYLSLDVEKHVMAHRPGSSCKICGENFSNQSELLNHLAIHSTIKPPVKKENKRFKCHLCERSFLTKKDVRRHLVVHTKKRDFCCQFCPQKFGRKDHLVRHVRTSHLNSGGVGGQPGFVKHERVVPEGGMVGGDFYMETHHAGSAAGQAVSLHSTVPDPSKLESPPHIPNNTIINNTVINNTIIRPIPTQATELIDPFQPPSFPDDPRKYMQYPNHINYTTQAVIEPHSELPVTFLTELNGHTSVETQFTTIPRDPYDMHQPHQQCYLGGGTGIPMAPVINPAEVSFHTPIHYRPDYA